MANNVLRDASQRRPRDDSHVDAGVRVHPRPPFEARRADIQRWWGRGVKGFWWPDHLMAFASRALWSDDSAAAVEDTRLHAYTDPFVSIAACADAVPDALLGICVTDAVRRMPATLVQAAMTLDHLAPGRIVLGLGAGEPANYVPYAWSVPSPSRRLIEAAAAIRAFLDDPGPDARGGVVGLRPPSGSPGPRLWMAAHGPRGLEATGRYADGWIPTSLDPPAWATARATVLEAAVRHGRDPARITMALSANVVLAGGHEAAHALLEHPAIRLHALLLSDEAFARHGAAHPLGRAGLHARVSRTTGQPPTPCPSNRERSISRHPKLSLPLLAGQLGVAPVGELQLCSRWCGVAQRRRLDPLFGM